MLQQQIKEVSTVNNFSETVIEKCTIADGLQFIYTESNGSFNAENDKCTVFYNFTKLDDELILQFARINENNNGKNFLENIEIIFSKKYIFQYLHTLSNEQNEVNDILQFNINKTFTASIDICKQSNDLLNAIILLNKNTGLDKILLSSYILHLLFLTIHNINIDPNIKTEKNEIFECKFLANEEGREKIYLAEKYMVNNLGTPFTIKELSKLVAINECYLKKGFKEIFGKTVNEYYQTKRMLYAKDLLYKQGLSVTEIASILGFSSISHFSTSFKKHTGIKPCELLMK